MDYKISYWLKEASETFRSARVLYNGQRFLETAFFCHLAIEKGLKAHVQRNQGDVPKIHNLLILAKKAELFDQLDESQRDFLAGLNTYQLEGRYPANREKIYQTTPRGDFEKILKRTEVELNWLKRQMK